MNAAVQGMIPMKAVLAAERQKLHYPRHYLVNGIQEENPEMPERVERLLKGAKDAGCEIVEPVSYGQGPIAAVHTPEYLQFLEHIHTRWKRMQGAADAVTPNIHPSGRDGVYPASAVAQAGWHMADASCPIADGTWESSCWSAWSAVHAAELVLAGEGAAYALCRPPGHHAFADMAGGFCYLNNTAIAAERLGRKHGRVAILDVDLHHGNGTQSIFYTRDDVLTVSLHADPVRFYPFFWGHADERGHGRGLGYNLNLPLPRGSRDDAYLTALDTALARIRAFAPDALVIALGLDAFEGDPFGGLAISTEGYGRIGGAVAAALKLPTVIVQEGGYLCDELGANLTAFLTGFGAARGS